MNDTIKFQIGKNGITNGVIESLSLILKNHRQIRISVLKNTGRNRENIEKIALDIQSKLKIKCDFRIIGFTIILIKSSRKNYMDGLSLRIGSNINVKLAT